MRAHLSARLVPAALSGGVLPGLSVWRVSDGELVPVPSAIHGLFYASNAYVLRLEYPAVTGGSSAGAAAVTGGESRVAVYEWHGASASAADLASAGTLAARVSADGGETRNGLKGGGAAAVMTRVGQGSEPAHFLAIFGGRMVVRNGSFGGEPADEHDADGVGLFHVFQHGEAAGGADRSAVRAMQVTGGGAAGPQRGLLCPSAPGTACVEGAPRRRSGGRAVCWNSHC